MKLIDADALRQAILTTMPERSEVLLIVDNQPEAVVRCKDCRFHYDAVERASETYWMPCDDYVTNDNWFCGWGKRKDGDGIK